MNTPLPRTTFRPYELQPNEVDFISYDRTIYALTLPKTTYDRKAICFDFTEDDLRPYDLPFMTPILYSRSYLRALLFDFTEDDLRP